MKPIPSPLLWVGSSLLVIVSKHGWHDTSDKVLALFLIATAFFIFFEILPQGMKMEDNLNSNRSNYKLYCSVENNVLTYLSNDKVDDKFVNYIDKLLEQYHAISFDLQSIPFSEIKNQFNEIKKSVDDNSPQEKIKTVYVPVYKPAEQSVIKNDTIK